VCVYLFRKSTAEVPGLRKGGEIVGKVPRQKHVGRDHHEERGREELKSEELANRKGRQGFLYIIFDIYPLKVPYY
jgi:hypothetical protein